MPADLNSAMPETGYPRPQYFVCREDGKLVPLIAVDELPVNVTIEGAPRAFGGLDETANMMSLGKVARAECNYSMSIATPSSTPDTASPEPTTAKAATAVLPADAESTPPNPWRPTLYKGLKPGHHYQGPRLGTNTGKRKKVYCTHWIHRGVCAFVHSPDGCKYKHEMPTDPETMKSVGLFGSYPKWWMDKSGSTPTDSNWRSSAPNRSVPSPSASPVASIDSTPTPPSWQAVSATPRQFSKGKGPAYPTSDIRTPDSQARPRGHTQTRPPRRFPRGRGGVGASNRRNFAVAAPGFGPGPSGKPHSSNKSQPMSSPSQEAPAPPRLVTKEIYRTGEGAQPLQPVKQPTPAGEPVPKRNYYFPSVPQDDGSKWVVPTAQKQQSSSYNSRYVVPVASAACRHELVDLDF